MATQEEIATHEQNRSFMAGRIAFRYFCVVYGLWMIFLATVVWQVVRR